MTTTPHGQVPEALIDLIDAYAETRHRYGGIYNARTEAARKAVIEALSGVQALSAAPAGWKLVPEDATEEMVRATDKVNFANADTDGTMHNVWNVMLAATPTPPAEQAAPKAAPGEQEPVFAEVAHRTAIAEAIYRQVRVEFDYKLGSWATLDADEQQRIVDSIRGLYAAPQPAPATQPAPQQEAQKPVATLHCNDIGYVWARATEVGTRMRFEQPINLYTAPQPAPQQEAQEPSHRETVDVVGVRSNGEHVNLEKIAMPPRMKAREIAIEQFGSFKDDDGSDAEMCFGALEYFLEWLIQQGWSKAPQPAPDCHHRPPCDECAAIAAQGGKDA